MKASVPAIKKKVTLKKEKEGLKDDTGLASPTSISMQNTFIIKNADQSFDVYWQQMRKRRMGQAHDMNVTGGPSMETKYGLVENI